MPEIKPPRAEVETAQNQDHIPFRDIIRSTAITAVFLGTTGFLAPEIYQDIDHTWIVFFGASCAFAFAKWGDTASTIVAFEYYENLPTEVQAYIDEKYDYYESQGQYGFLHRTFSKRPSREELLARRKVLRDATDLIAATLAFPLAPLYLAASAAATYNNWHKRRTMSTIATAHKKGELPALIWEDLTWGAYNICLLFKEREVTTLSIPDIIADARLHGYDYESALLELQKLTVVNIHDDVNSATISNSFAPHLATIPKQRRLTPLRWSS